MKARKMSNIDFKIKRLVEDYTTLKFESKYYPYSSSSRSGSHIRNLTEMFSHIDLSNRSIELWAINEAGGICYGCLKPVFILMNGKLALENPDNPEARDHILPASKGYLYTLGNVGLMHATCNGEKSDMSLKEYYNYLRITKGFTEVQINTSKIIIKALQRPIKSDKGYRKFFKEIALINDSIDSSNILLSLQKAYIKACDKEVIKSKSVSFNSRDFILKALEDTLFDSILEKMDFDKRHSLVFTESIFEEAIDRNIDLMLRESIHMSNFVNLCKDKYKEEYINTDSRSGKRTRNKNTVLIIFEEIDIKYNTNFANEISLYSESNFLDISSDSSPKIYRDMNYLIESTTFSRYNKDSDKSAFRKIAEFLIENKIDITGDYDLDEALKTIQYSIDFECAKVKKGAKDRYIHVSNLFSILLKHPSLLKFVEEISETSIKPKTISRIMLSVIRDYKVDAEANFTPFFESNPYKKLDLIASINYKDDKLKRFSKFYNAMLDKYAVPIVNDFSEESIVSNFKLIERYTRKRISSVNSQSEKSRYKKYGNFIKECFTSASISLDLDIEEDQVFSTSSIF